jgi:hypothetical protein
MEDQKSIRWTVFPTIGLTMKLLFAMALRQSTRFAWSLLRLIGPDWNASDFSTLSRRLKILKVSIPQSWLRRPPASVARHRAMGTPLVREAMARRDQC